jgi:hypothetical protein
MVILYYPQKQQINNRHKVLTDLHGSLYLFFWEFHDKQWDQALLRNEAKPWAMQYKCGLSTLATQEINKSREKVNCNKKWE